MGTDVEVPSYFRCPISMELMRDPVTVSTGMTYDRQSIEHWVYTCKKRTCPATMQELQNLEFTPNHTLRRLIQGWCVVNSSKGVDRIPTPKSPVDPMQVADLLQQAARSKPAQAVHALKKLRFLAKESERNLRCIGSVGPGPVLISLLGSCYREEIWNSSLESQSLLSSYCREEIENENSRIWEEALGVLHLLPATQDTAKLLSEPAAMRSLALILQRGSSEARLHAVILLQNVAERILDWEPVVRQNNDVLHRLVEMLRDEFCHQATIAALDVIKAMCMHSRRNKLKAVEAGLVFVLIELLPEAEGIKVEKILELLDKLSDCAEGRAAVASHAMGVAAVSKMIMRMSEFATRKAVRILWSLCIFSPSAAVLRDMLQFGGASKLCVLLQIECTRKTKQKAKDILKLHGKTWCSSPCFPSSFRLFFPD